MNTEIALPLEKMTIAEKLEIIELVWADLAQNPDDIPSPAWHRTFLDGREAAIANGTDRFIDLDESELRIRKLTS